MSGEFCDTNVLVYAYDRSAKDKRREAMRLVDRLWDSGTGVLSIQVLQEMFVSLTRKVSHPLSVPDARSVVADMATWRVIEPTRQDVLTAIDVAARWQISFWDAMVIAAAIKAETSVLWSEDLNAGQTYDGLVVRNPFVGVDPA